MEIIQERLEDIFPYENNPRVNDGAVDAVANSIRDFGFLQPIVVDRNGIIIVGHTRYRAAAKLGLKEVPVVVAANLSDKKAQAYRLADNKTGEISSWAFDRLMTELDALDQSGIDLTPYGFAEALGKKDDDGPNTEPKEVTGGSKYITCPRCGFCWEK